MVEAVKTEEGLDQANLFSDRRTKLPSQPDRELPPLTAVERILGKPVAWEHRDNPQGIRSAHGYYEYLKGRGQASVDQLGYQGHLDDQEALRGYTSFPEDHPWHPANRERATAEQQARSSRREALRNYMTPRTEPGEDPVRRNTTATTCARCKNAVPAGEGVYTKTDRGYRVVHEHGCTPREGRPAGQPRTSRWTD